MTRTAKSFNRRRSHLQPQPLVLVICEDKKSSKRYLEDASLFFRVNVKVRITHCGKTDPINIVGEAIDNLGKYDRIFCVIDRDTHHGFDAALETAKKHANVKVIPSYPCFEYWLLLHFTYSRKPYATAGKKSAGDCVVDDLKCYPLMASYEKGTEESVFDALQGEPIEKATERAIKALADAENCGELNPSTELHILLAFLKSLAEPVEVF